MIIVRCIITAGETTGGPTSIIGAVRRASDEFGACETFSVQATASV